MSFPVALVHLLKVLPYLSPRCIHLKNRIFHVGRRPPGFRDVEISKEAALVQMNLSPFK